MHARALRYAAQLSVLLIPTFLFSQQPQSDPQAVSLAQQSIAALTNSVAVADVTLSGNVTWVAGSDNETGSVTLLAKGTDESRIDLNLSGGKRTEIRNADPGFPQGESIAPDGSINTWALHNCWINASWFFPALSVLASSSDPSLVWTYVGVEPRGSGTVQHIQVYRYLTGQKVDVISLTQSVSTEDIYLDFSSLLPMAFTFNTHPDDDALTNVPVEIDFSNYVSINGVEVPMLVNKSSANGLTLYVSITNTTVNSGLSDALFVLQ